MFSWIAAGSSFLSYGGMNLYVRYKQREGDFEEKKVSEGFFVKLKDREFLLTRPAWKDYDLYLGKSNWDFGVDLDMLGIDSAIKHTGLMYCYEHKKVQYNFSYNKAMLSTPIFGDSGGYKLAVGTEEFINPVLLAEWYNKFVTRGITLDIPPHSDISEKDLLESARIQKLNTNIILDNLSSNIPLYNVSHGFNVEERKKFIDVVYDDRLDHWAIGSTYYGNIFDFIYNCMSTMLFLGKKKFHIFGVAAAKIIPILSWMGRYFDITSDSSTHLQSARCSIMLNTQGFGLKKVALGKVNIEAIQTKDVNQYLNCSCNLCNALKTSEIYYNGSGILTSLILSLHNINALSQYAQIWNDFARISSISEFKAIFKKILPKKEVKNWLSAIDFIDTCMEFGVEKAAVKYRAYMSTFNGRAVTNCLQKTVSFLQVPTEEEEKESVEKKEEELSASIRYQDLLSKYNEYHITNSDSNIRKSQKRMSKEVKYKIGIRGAVKNK